MGLLERNKKGAALAAGVFLVTAWAVAIWHLSTEWSINEQYRHGWIVPLLALYAFRLRLERCPDPSRPLGRRMAAIGSLVIALSIGISVLFREANPEWRLLGWLLSSLAMALTFLWVASSGGWAWTRHFAFPILFFYTAVPWPRPLENAIMAGLMQRNALVATEGLRWLGFDAAAKGNLIHVATGVVGVEEACSGVRSLQGALMMTLFVGELLRLGWLNRALLFVLGLTWVLLANGVRTIWLGCLAARDGPAAMEQWHDVAGYTILGAGFVVLLGAAMFLRRLSMPVAERAAVAHSNGMGQGSFIMGLQRMNLAGRASLALVILSVAGTKFWFAWNERSVVRQAGWNIRFPQSSPGYHERPIAEHIRADLRYDEGRSAGWEDGDGRPWRALFFRWKPGFNGEQSVNVHDPRVCLQASGLEFVESIPSIEVVRGDMHLVFEGYRFRDDSLQDVFVFNCVTSDALRTRLQSLPKNTWTVATRFQAVAAGIRNLGQRRLEIAIWGVNSPDEAERKFRQFLEESLIIEPPTLLGEVPRVEQAGVSLSIDAGVHAMGLFQQVPRAGKSKSPRGSLLAGLFNATDALLSW